MEGKNVVALKCMMLSFNPEICSVCATTSEDNVR